MFSWLGFLLFLQSAAAAPSHSSVSQIGKEPNSFPLVILVINQENHDVYVYPGAPIEAYEKDSRMAESNPAFAGALRYLPMPPLQKVLASPEEINSLQLSLPQRAATYTQTVLRGIGQLKLVTSFPWTQSVLKVVERMAAIDASQTILSESGAAKRKLLWPPRQPLLLTELKNQSGILVVVEVRSDSNAGVVEQLDFMGFVGGRLTRTNWSRKLQDPTLFKKTDEAIGQVAGKFLQRFDLNVHQADFQRLGKGGAEQSRIRLDVSRLLGESDLLAIEKIVAELGAKGTPILTPVGVTRDGVIYSTFVPVAKKRMLEKSILNAQPNILVNILVNAGENSAKGEGATTTLELRPNPTLQKDPKKSK